MAETAVLSATVPWKRTASQIDSHSIAIEIIVAKATPSETQMYKRHGWQE